MTPQPSDLYDLLKEIRYETTAIQAKVTDCFKILRELNLPTQDEVRCETCGIPFRGPNTLAEHVYTSHGGPLPAHYERAEQLSDEPPLEVDESLVGWPYRGEERRMTA